MPGHDPHLAAEAQACRVLDSSPPAGTKGFVP